MQEYVIGRSQARRLFIHHRRKFLSLSLSPCLWVTTTTNHHRHHHYYHHHRLWVCAASSPFMLHMFVLSWLLCMHNDFIDQLFSSFEKTEIHLVLYCNRIRRKTFNRTMTFLHMTACLLGSYHFVGGTTVPLMLCPSTGTPVLISPTSDRMTGWVNHTWC